MAGDVTSDLDLRDYARVLRRRRGVILTSLILVTAAAMAVTFVQQPAYEAVVKVVLQPRATGSIFDSSSRAGADPTRAARTEIEVIESRPVRVAVQRSLGLPGPLRVSAEPVEGTDVIAIRARDADADRAAAIADAVAREYKELRQRQVLDELLAGTEAIKARVAALQQRIDAARASTQQGPAPSGGEVVGTRAVDPVLQTLLDQQAMLSQRLDEAQVEAALRAGGPQVIAPATVPSSPVEPQPRRNAALALSAGLLLGIGLALVVDHLDDAVRTRDDLAAAAGGVPIVGVVPVVPRQRGRPGALASADLNSPAGEAYRSVRTSLQLLSVDRPLRRVLVTSPMGEEGKSTTVANLAVALGRAGERVVVVDGDLRRPTLHRLFGLDNAVGLTSVIVGDAALDAALQHVPGEANLRVLASGPKPPTPPEMLSSARTARLLDDLTAAGWVVLVDSPPLFLVTDAVVLARRVDAVVVVVSAGMSTRRQVHRASEMLAQVNAPVVAALLNRAEPEPGDGFSSNYHHEPDPPPAAQRGRSRTTRRWGRRRVGPSTGVAEWPRSIDDPEVLLGGREPVPAPPERPWA